MDKKVTIIDAKALFKKDAEDVPVAADDPTLDVEVVPAEDRMATAS